jgi:hypothetical protein
MGNCVSKSKHLCFIDHYIKHTLLKIRMEIADLYKTEAARIPRLAFNFV